MPGGLNAPLEVILSWPRPNYVDPELRPNTMTWVAAICGPITVSMLLTRLWVRIFHQRNPGWDDWLMLAGTIPTMAYTIMLPLAEKNGFNRHVWDLDLFKESETLVTSRKYVLALECVFCVASGFIKVSILLFYRRLSSRVVSTAFRWTTWLTIGGIVAYTIALTLAPIFGCNPISAFWDQVDAHKKLQGYQFECFDEGADVFAASIISVAQDFLTAVLPTFLYWNLQISMRKKVALFGIFALGYGVVALGGLRAYYTWRTFYETYDVTWSTWDLMIVSALELHVGAFCGNAPTLKVFFKHFFHDKLTSFTRSKSSTKDHKHSAQSHSTGSTGKSSSSVLSKVASFFGHSNSKSGYISESNNVVSVDMHGGVQVQKEVRVVHSPPASIRTSNKHDTVNTTDMLYEHYCNDIEMGPMSPDGMSQGSCTRSSMALDGEEISALPPMPGSSTPASRPPSTFDSFTSHASHSHEIQEQPRVFGPTVTPVEQVEKPRTPTPMPSFASNHKRNWKSWA